MLSGGAEWNWPSLEWGGDALFAGTPDETIAFYTEEASHPSSSFMA